VILADAELAALELAQRDPAGFALEIELGTVDRVSTAVARADLRLLLVEAAVGRQVDENGAVLRLPGADGGLFERRRSSASVSSLTVN